MLEMLLECKLTFQNHSNYGIISYTRFTALLKNPYHNDERN